MPARGGLEVEPTTRPRPNRLPGRSAHEVHHVYSHRQCRGCGDTRPSLCVGSRPSKNDVKCGARNHRHTRAVSTSPDRSRQRQQTRSPDDSMIVPLLHGSYQNPHSTLLLPPRTTAPQGVHRDAPRHTVIIHRFQIVAVVHLHATVDTFSLRLRLSAGTHDPTPHSPGEPQCRSV